MNNGILFKARPGARDKTEALFKEITSLHPGNDYSKVLYLGPNNYVLSAAGRRFFAYSIRNQRAAYIPFDSITIRQLAGAVHETCFSGNSISESIRTLLLCELLKEGSLGYARLLSDLFNKARQFVLDKDLSHLKADIRKLIFDEKAGDRAVQAVETLELYQTLLSGKNILDPADVLINCADILNKNKDSSISIMNYKTLVIDGFFDPAPVELKIMEALEDRAENVFIMADEDTEILKHFMKSGRKMHVQELESNYCREGAGYFSYPSMEEEIEGIAKNIRKLNIEGIKPWEITVCFPVLSKYLSMLRRVFGKYRIPVNISEYNMSSSGPVVALLELITCIEEDYPAKDFLSFVTSPFFPSLPSPVKERAVSYAYSAGIVKGKQSWLSVGDTLLNSQKKSLSDDEIEFIYEFQKAIEKTISSIEDIKRKKDLLSFLDAFESTLESFGFFNSLESSPSGHLRDDILNKITNQINELRAFAILNESVNNPCTTYLRYLLQDLKGPEENRDGVNIVSFELAAGIETKALFFGGMIEGDFPSKPGIDPILPENVKKALGMPYLEYYLNRQKQYFKRLLNVSLMEPQISCPAADGDKVFLPSPFLNWGGCLGTPDYNIYTEEDVLTRQGANKQVELPPGSFLGGELSFDKKAVNILRKKIGLMADSFISVTDLDFYRKCPRRFYIEKVLGFEMDTPPKFEVEARLWGSLAHKIMENLFRDGDVQPEELEEKLFESLEQSIKHFPIGDFWSKVAKEIFQNLLPLLKKQESNLRTQGFSPFLTEKKLKAEINGIKLKGKIDRIDRKAGEFEEGQGQPVVLLDYKTGNGDPDSLQLPLYARMWQEITSGQVENIGYYSLKDCSVKWLGKKEGIEALIQNALQEAEKIAAEIKKGIFPSTPLKDAECRYCHHKPLCGGPK